ncbi:DUF2878 domain-containing protein [Vibrio sp. STUT-A11]|uniref:DUF2878 domain-containing protein n=1 Tax=Vibrio sp. STUT-A11 TaxID=2976236 RepID=UPI00222EDAD8|nr:DUF2878 domain-containing protein [Vibrio sp. STUT-A11]BDR13940.1 zinc ABC transporter permease [Vibrio sp. STUT-A11]
MRVLLASTWFQLCWLAAVLGTYQWQWFTLCFTLVTIAYCALNDAAALKPIVVVVVFGLALDSLNQQFSVLIFPTLWLPLWLLCLWLMFTWYAYQLKPVLYRFPKTYVSVIGGIGGSASYFAGYKLQAVDFGYDVFFTLMVLFVEWCVVTLLILRVYGNEKLTGKVNQESN